MSPTRFHVDDTGQWSGGGSGVLANLALAVDTAASLSSGPRPGSVAVVPRNVPTSWSTMARAFVWMPQNALPWGPPSAEERTLQRALRAASGLVSARARAMVRISGAIPPLSRQRPTSEVLHNVLDAGFDTVLPTAVSPGTAFLTIGSAHGYRHLVPLVAGYERYRAGGGRSGLTIITTAGSPVVQKTLDELATTVPGLVHHPGSLDRAEALEAMAASRGVVLPSSVEASPITLLEARALGRPVACSRIRAHDEILDGERVPRFDTHEPETVARALDELDELGGHAPHPLQDAVTRSVRRAEWVTRLTGFLHGLG